MLKTSLVAVLLVTGGVLGVGLASGARHGPMSVRHPGTVAAMRPPLVAAHRGGYFGTQAVLRQFKATVDAGQADILEMDLRVSRDGTVYVFHDGTLDAKSNCKGDFAVHTDAELALCRLRQGDPIPRFSDVLAMVHGRAIVNAEFKTLEAVAPAIRIARQMDTLPWTYFQAQDDREKYAAARAVAPEAWLQFKVNNDADIDWLTAQNDPYLRIAEMNAISATPARVARLHAAGKLVSVNSWRYQLLEERLSASCDAVFGRGIDIAVTNNPAGCSSQRDTPLGQTGDGWLQRASLRFNTTGGRGGGNSD